jgi:hypothetical protein
MIYTKQNNNKKLQHLFQIPPTTTVHTQEYSIANPDYKDNIITKLLNKPFRNVISSERLDILRQERPTPSFSDGEYYMKELNLKSKRILITTQWLTAYSNTNKLYCWSCLLFNSNINNWNSGSGYEVNPTICENMSKHCRDTNHHFAVRKYNHYQKLVQLCAQNYIMNNIKIATCEKLSDEYSNTSKTKGSEAILLTDTVYLTC